MSMLQQKMRPSVQLALNGTPIYLMNANISGSFTREEKDMSGKKSSTLKADKGVKAKKLSVNGTIPYREKEWLTTILNFAEAVDSKGEQVKYRVSSATAEALNMREVEFSGTVSITEQKDLLAWAISFELREVNSVSEKKEQRKTKPKARVQSESAPASKGTPKVSKEESINRALEDKNLDHGGYIKAEDESFAGLINEGKFKQAMGLEKTQGQISRERGTPKDI